MPQFSIITTCKGRLHHLRQSLPRFLAQSDAEVIVVDYDCPDGTAAVVERDFPAAQVVAIADAPHFSAADARNLGASVATGDWLAFIDADILVVPEMMARLAERIAPQGHYYRFPDTRTMRFDLYGSCMVRRADFVAVMGYDSVMQGYGGEDSELYTRLNRLKLQRALLDPAWVERVLEHDNAARGRFHIRPDILDALRINVAYRLVKAALIRQWDVPELPETTRKAVYALVEQRITEALAAGEEKVRIAIPLPPDREVVPVWEWDVERYLYFDLTPRKLNLAKRRE